jgi:hypothetical protein
MTGEFIVTEIKTHNPIEGADRIVWTEMCGEIAIVSISENPIGTRGIIIDCESKLFPEIASRLNMYRHKELNEDVTKVGYLGDNGRIKPIRLKGVQCTCLFLSFAQLEPVIGTIELDNGVQDHKINGVTICEKYVRKYATTRANLGKLGKARENRVPLFKEHMSTDHLMRYYDKLKDGDHVTMTCKLHGTSGRTGYLPIVQKKKWYHKLFGTTPDPQYGYVVGSRKVVKTIEGDKREGNQDFYDDDIWSLASKKVEGKLCKGETVYFEIVGQTPSGQNIQPTHVTRKLKDFFSKEEYDRMIEFYGAEIPMQYGCDAGEFNIFVYRMTLTNEQGSSVDYSWERVKRRCEEMEIEHCPEIISGYLTNESGAFELVVSGGLTNFKSYVEYETTKVPCDFFPNTLREGVVVRIDRGGEAPLLFKHKSFAHKVLEGIVKDSDKLVDMEEQESI